MAVKKIKWKELMNNLSADDVFDDISEELGAIDEALNGYLSESYSLTPLTSLASYIETNIVTDDSDGMWADMPIWLSSYYEKDKRFILLMQNKLREYISFYKKILTDEGVQRHLVYSKEYENDGNSNNNERGTNSNVPQNSNLYDSEHPESNAKFDQAIADYASSINKNKSDTTSHTEGTSGTTISGTTWEEGKKNIQMLFFNELKDYIMTIPERIYSYYALETIPAPDLVKRFIQHLYEVKDIIVNE